MGVHKGARAPELLVRVSKNNQLSKVQVGSMMMDTTSE